MKTQDFIMPTSMEESREVIFKGKVYECQGTLVMATETTCSLTKSHFKGICVGRNDKWSENDMVIIGSKASCMIVNYKESELPKKY
tara:strand:- start:7143 stop:7400 length:258 start_codon:yes stop_codon:yes gene_type:complete